MTRFNRLWMRLSLAFLLVSALAIVAVSLGVQQVTESGFQQYVNMQHRSGISEDMVEAAQNYYAGRGSWTGVASVLTRGHGHGAGMQFALADTDGEIVAASDTTLIGGTLDDPKSAAVLVVNGEQVGWLAQGGRITLGTPEQAFLDDVTRRLILAGIIAVVLSVLLGIVLAWNLTRPLRQLTSAAHTLAGGKLGEQVPVRGSQETLELAQAFNAMSANLAKSDSLRQHMSADIAHELRTPVSVLRGHLEAMLDGVYPLDTQHLAVAYDQTLHLARLVDDLRLLTLAESGQLTLQYADIPARQVIERAFDRFQPLALDAGIQLESQIDPTAALIRVDEDRMQQVMGNLLVNALRHTPQGGHIHLRMQTHQDTVRFVVSNSGNGLSADELQHIFERFWRTSRDGSGLGLAIVRQLVELHGARIWAESQMGETTFTVAFPYKKT